MIKSGNVSKTLCQLISPIDHVTFSYSILSLILCHITEMTSKQFVIVKLMISCKDNTKNICLKK